MTWFELSKLAEGARLRFVEPHDIFPECVVPAGTRCQLLEQGLNEKDPAVLLLPDDDTLQDSLRAWGGLIYLPVRGDWNDESSLEVEQ